MLCFFEKLFYRTALLINPAQLDIGIVSKCCTPPPQLNIVDKILNCMKIEVLVEDAEVKWSHEMGAVLPRDGGDVEGYDKVEICDRQRLQDVSIIIS